MFISLCINERIFLFTLDRIFLGIIGKDLRILNFNLLSKIIWRSNLRATRSRGLYSNRDGCT
jgi:hypothetical protein